MRDYNQLFTVQCNNCGSPVGYDIPRQSYRCAQCGTVSHKEDTEIAWKLSGIVEEHDIPLHVDEITCTHCGGIAQYNKENQKYLCAYCGSETTVESYREAQWKQLNKNQWNEIERNEKVSECPNCGSVVIFQKGEASETCAFCGSHLVDSAIRNDEHVPEFIIPFVLTEEEAKERLKTFASKSNTKDMRRVLQNINELKGYYLPYRMIRGPLQGSAYRDLMSRKYQYRGYLEYAFIQSSKQMDNELLDQVEPFDLSMLKPMKEEYIGGYRVKLEDLADGEIQSRTLKEAQLRYRPYVNQALHHFDAEVEVKRGDFLQIPILLPVYVQKVGGYFAIVNGQTGKVVIDSSKKAKESKLWLVEPTVLTLLAMLAAAYFFNGYLEGILMAGVIAGLVFYTAFGQDRNGVLIRKIYKSKDSQATRFQEQLLIDEKQTSFKNVFPNTPIFYVHEGNQDIQVELKFYSIPRILEMSIRLFILIFLPAICAAILSIVMNGNMNAIFTLPYQYGAAWYVMAGSIAIIYWIRGVRWDVFNHPILYQILPDGKRKLYGTRKSRKMSILSIFHIESWKDIQALGGLGIASILFLAFLVLGSTLAILF